MMDTNTATAGTLTSSMLLGAMQKVKQTYSPIDLIPNHHMLVFFRRPRTRKMRIVKKWMKKPENWKPDTQVFVMGDGFTGRKLVAHPQTIDRIKRRLKADGLYPENATHEPCGD